MPDRSTITRIRLVFADKGNFHAETVHVAADRLAAYDRLLDFIREDADVTRQLYVDLKRLVSAYVIEEED